MDNVASQFGCYSESVWMLYRVSMDAVSSQYGCCSESEWML